MKDTTTAGDQALDRYLPGLRSALLERAEKLIENTVAQHEALRRAWVDLVEARLTEIVKEAEGKLLPNGEPVKVELGTQGRGTYYNATTGTIVIDASTLSKSPERLLWDIPHEIQHVEQHIQGYIPDREMITNADTYARQMVGLEAEAIHAALVEIQAYRAALEARGISVPTIAYPYLDGNTVPTVDEITRRLEAQERVASPSVGTQRQTYFEFYKNQAEKILDEHAGGRHRIDQLMPQVDPILLQRLQGLPARLLQPLLDGVRSGRFSAQDIINLLDTFDGMIVALRSGHMSAHPDAVNKFRNLDPDFLLSVLQRGKPLYELRIELGLSVRDAQPLLLELITDIQHDAREIDSARESWRAMRAWEQDREDTLWLLNKLEGLSPENIRKLLLSPKYHIEQIDRMWSSLRHSFTHPGTPAEATDYLERIKQAEPETVLKLLDRHYSEAKTLYEAWQKTQDCPQPLQARLAAMKADLYIELLLKGPQGIQQMNSSWDTLWQKQELQQHLRAIKDKDLVKILSSNKATIMIDAFSKISDLDPQLSSKLTHLDSRTFLNMLIRGRDNIYYIGELWDNRFNLSDSLRAKIEGLSDKDLAKLLQSYNGRGPLPLSGHVRIWQAIWDGVHSIFNQRTDIDIHARLDGLGSSDFTSLLLREISIDRITHELQLPQRDDAFQVLVLLSRGWGMRNHPMRETWDITPMRTIWGRMEQELTPGTRLALENLQPRDLREFLLHRLPLRKLEGKLAAYGEQMQQQVEALDAKIEAIKSDPARQGELQDLLKQRKEAEGPALLADNPQLMADDSKRMEALREASLIKLAPEERQYVLHMRARMESQMRQMDPNHKDLHDPELYRYLMRLNSDLLNNMLLNPLRMERLVLHESGIVRMDDDAFNEFFREKIVPAHRMRRVLRSTSQWTFMLFLNQEVPLQNGIPLPGPRPQAPGNLSNIPAEQRERTLAEYQKRVDVYDKEVQRRKDAWDAYQRHLQANARQIGENWQNIYNTLKNNDQPQYQIALDHILQLPQHMRTYLSISEIDLAKPDGSKVELARLGMIQMMLHPADLYPVLRTIIAGAPPKYERYNAHWATLRELVRLNDRVHTYKSACIGIDDIHYLPIYIPEKGHVLSIGRTGSGKTATELGPQIQSFHPEQSGWMFDVKEGELSTIFGGRWSETHKVVKISFRDPFHSTRVNLLKHVPVVDHSSGTEAYYASIADQERMASVLAEAWLKWNSTPETTDNLSQIEHTYSGVHAAAIKALEAAICHLRETDPDAPFYALGELFTAPERFFQEILGSKQFNNGHYSEHAQEIANDLIRQSETYLRNGLFPLIQGSLSGLKKAGIKALTEENEFDPAASLREPQVVVWDFPFTAARVPSMDGLMRTIYDVSMFEVTEAIDMNKRLPLKEQEDFQTLKIAADECGVLSNGYHVPLPRMAELAAVHRSYKIFYLMASQLYNKFDSTLRGQCEVMVVTRSDPEDAELLAKRFGQRPVWYYNGARTDHKEHTSSLGRSQQIGKVVPEITANEGERERQVRSEGWDQRLEALISADAIGRLPMGTLIVYFPGNAPIRVYGRDSTSTSDLVQGETIFRPLELQREAYIENWTPEWMLSSTAHHTQFTKQEVIGQIESEIARVGRSYREQRDKIGRMQSLGPGLGRIQQQEERDETDGIQLRDLNLNLTLQREEEQAERLENKLGDLHRQLLQLREPTPAA